jgi:hypothetical protein
MKGNLWRVSSFQCASGWVCAPADKWEEQRIKDKRQKMHGLFSNLPENLRFL